MERIEPGYDLYAVEADGKEQLVHQTDATDPEKIIFGVTRGMIAPLEKAIEGLEPGGKFNVTATAEEAFGPYDPEQVVELERDIFVVDGKFDESVIKVGALVPMMTADGFRIAEEDLKLRGPGDFFGQRQHGLPQLGIADLAGDMRVLKEAQQAAQVLLEADPGLSRREHAPLLGRVRRLFAQHGDMFN